MKQDANTRTCKCQYSKVVDKLHELRESAFLYDIKVTYGQFVSFKAHRCILAANSLYFKGIFTTAEGTQLESVDISRETTHSDYIDNVLEYMYSGYVNLHVDNVIGIAALSSALQCSDLLDVCVEYLDRVVDSSNCLYLFLRFCNLRQEEDKQRDSLKRIETTLWCRVEENFYSTVILSDDILKIPLDDLLHFLSHISVSDQHLHNLSLLATRWLNSHTDNAALQVADVISSLVLKCSQTDQMRTKNCVKYVSNLLQMLQKRETTSALSERIVANLETALANYNIKAETDIEHQAKDDCVEINEMQVPEDIKVDTYSGERLSEKGNHYDSDTDEFEEVKKDEDKDSVYCEGALNSTMVDRDLCWTSPAQITVNHGSPSQITVNHGSPSQITVNHGRVCKKNCVTATEEIDKANHGYIEDCKKHILDVKQDESECEESVDKDVGDEEDGVGRQGNGSERGLKLNFVPQNTRKKQLSQARQHKKLSRKLAAVSGKVDVKYELTDDGKKRYRCDQCYKTFTRNSGLHKHVLIHTGKRPFTCSECNMGFKTKYQLKWHKSKIHVGLTELRCMKCGLRFFKKSNYDKHSEHCEGKKLSCDVCGKLFQYKVELDRHAVSHSDIRTHTCHQCPRRFKHAQNLKAHVLLKHENIDKVTSPSVCDHCGKVLKNRNCLRRHLLIHAVEKPYKCRLCSKSYTQSTGLEVHMRLHTGDKPYQCEICSEMFVIKCNLDRHIQRHLGDKPHKCDQCDKAFVQITDLKRHQTVHSGVKKFPCQFCGKLFALKKSVPIHERIHTGDRPFKCVTCKKCFLTRSDLKRHEKTHLKEKPASRLCREVQDNITDSTRNRQNELPMVNFMESYQTMDRMGYHSLTMNRNDITPQNTGQFVSPFSTGIGFY